ncbi:hypothetical protein ACQKDS_07330 [Serratia sp. NPDC078593]|uniref:hypothetical protein n=1 Tax=unclassified Serratia (in: enterobacteria) TaxID=2647522 RepID=UPI0037D39736
MSNIDNLGFIVVDEHTDEIGHEEVLYVGKGAKRIEFSSVNPAKPTKFYYNSAPAHSSYPNKKITLAETSTQTLCEGATSSTSRALNSASVVCC